MSDAIALTPEATPHAEFAVAARPSILRFLMREPATAIALDPAGRMDWDRDGFLKPGIAGIWK